jgi:peptide/nickel transport system substrate-binding protein
MRKIYGVVISATVLFASVSTVHAQKSKDTLRHAHPQAIATLDPYLDPRPEVYFASELSFDRLIMMDEAKGQYTGLLAKSWSRIDSKTIEFELRDDVKWSDGQKFTSDDVVYTLQYLTDPKSNFRFASDFDWIDRVEKLGPSKVRIIASRAVPYDLARFSGYTFMFPRHIHVALDAKQDFGRTPVGTGPYRVVQIDKNTGIRAERRDDYPQANSVKKHPSIRNFVMRGIPDQGSRIAELMAGNIDLIGDLSPDQALDLAKSPGQKLTTALPFAYQYMLIDMKGRSGVAPLKDVRVRQAILHAIDTQQVNKVIGGDTMPLRRPEALCSRIQFGCDYSVTPPPYDREKARKLLVDAGYANGFDLQLMINATSGKDIAEVVVGQLRAVGIRASIDVQTFASYRKLQNDGRISALISGWGGGALSDVTGTLGFLFEEGARDYHGNPDWLKWAREANEENDDRTRRALVKKLFDDVTTQGYIVPVAPLPRHLVHTADLQIAPASAFNAYGMDIWSFSWR